MKKLENVTVNAKDQTYSLAELIDPLKRVPSAAVVEYVRGLGLTLPKTIRMDALKTVLHPILEKQRVEVSERAHASDNADRFKDLRRAERLHYYKEFSETELEDELADLDDASVIDDYLTHLWEGMLSYLVDQGFGSESFEPLAEIALEIEREAIKDIATYNGELSECFYDKEGEIDGLPIDKFRKVATRSSNVKELIQIGKKYHVDVPRYLRKKEMQDIVFKQLEDRGELDEELKSELLGMKVKDLEAWSKENDIIASPYFDKPKTVEYILRNASSTKEIYTRPKKVEKPSEKVEEKPEPKEPEVVAKTPEKPQEKPKEPQAEPAPVEAPTPPQVHTDIESVVKGDLGLDGKSWYRRLVIKTGLLALLIIAIIIAFVIIFIQIF